MAKGSSRPLSAGQHRPITDAQKRLKDEGDSVSISSDVRLLECEASRANALLAVRLMIRNNKP